MATVGKATRLDNLRTDGVALVKRGANNRRIALAKHGDDVDETIEKLFLEVIAKGDMEMDEQAVEDMCAQAGLDPQATETFKAIMKLAYAYRDSDAMKGLLKTVFAQAAKPGQPGGQPGAPMQAGAQPGAPGQGAQAQPGQGQPPAPGQTQHGNPMQPGQGAAPAPGQAAAPGQQPAPGQDGKTPDGKAPPFAPKGEEGEGSPKEEQQDAAGTEPGEGTPEEEAGDEPGKKKNPFAKSATSAKETDMDEKKVAELVAKAQADAKAESDKKIAEQEAIIKSQEAALKANTDAVKKMQDDLRLSQWVSKAEKELGFISGKTADELGKMLFDIDTLNADAAKAQFELLKSQAAVVKSSGLFRPSGSGVSKGAPQNALEEIEKRTAEIVSKSAGSGKPAEVLKAEAQLAVMKADPALYKRYCDEQDAINREALGLN